MAGVGLTGRHDPGREPRSQLEPGAALDHRFDRDGLYALRAAVAAHATQLGASPDRVEDLVVVANELASNAVRHGGGAGRLRLWRDGDLICCEIVDRGRGLPEPQRAGTLRPLLTAAGGRGLWIVRRLCRRVQLRTGPGGTTVIAAVALD